MLSHYERLVVYTCHELYREGAIDPTFLEIACRYRRKPPPPPDFPWTTTDPIEQAVIGLVHNCIDHVQNEFVNNHRLLPLPVTAEYYDHGHRNWDHGTPSTEQIDVCMPRGFHPAVGFRFAQPDDPYYAVYIEKRGIRMTSGVRNAVTRLRIASEDGLLARTTAIETRNKMIANIGDLSLPDPLGGGGPGTPPLIPE